MIPVTKPFLPVKSEVFKYLDGIWERNWLTNNGPLVNEYELKLKNYLSLDHLLLTNNGTISLQIAIKALNLTGEIITTPFSYVASTSSIVWEGCKPVFIDIDLDTWNIDPNKIEEAITQKTSAILATHCFGNACDIDRIEQIAKKHDIKVIFDASHCFGTRYNGKSIFEFGDISTLSLHATKPVHCVEGGLVVTKNHQLLKTMAYMRNFGHDGQEKFNGIGINGKNSEFHASVGLSVLESADIILSERKNNSIYYNSILENLKVQKLKIQENCDFNYAYYPIVFDNQEFALKAQSELLKNEISTRRYFYPLLSNLDYVENKNLPNAKKISESILCLPLFYGLSFQEQDMIARILLRIQKYQ